MLCCFFSVCVCFADRLDAIFNSKHLHVHVVKDRDILWMVLKLVLVDIAILLIWDSHSPLYRSLQQATPVLDPLNYNQLLVPTLEFCRSPNFTMYVGVFLAYKALVLLAGLFLALRVRKINIPNLNDSKFIVLSIYQVVVISSMLIAVSIVISSSPQAFYLIVSIGLLFLVTAVLSLLYLPRVLSVCYGIDFLSDKPSVGATGASPDSKDTGSSLSSDALKAEMTKLKQRLTQAQQEVKEARKQLQAAGLELKLPQAPTGLPPHSPLRHTATSPDRVGGGGGPGGGGSARSPPSPMLMPARNPTSDVVGGGAVSEPASARHASLNLPGLAPVSSGGSDSSTGSTFSSAAVARRVDPPAVRVHLHALGQGPGQGQGHIHLASASSKADPGLELSSDLRPSPDLELAPPSRRLLPLGNIAELASMPNLKAPGTNAPSAVDIVVGPNPSPSANKPVTPIPTPSPLPGTVSANESNDNGDGDAGAGGDGDANQLASPSAVGSALPDASAAAAGEDAQQDNRIQAPKRISP